MTHSKSYTTAGQISIAHSVKPLTYSSAIDQLVTELNHYRGALFSSNFEFPGRYTCWDIGFINPPLVIESQQRNFTILALNQRGQFLLSIIERALESVEYLASIDIQTNLISGTIKINNNCFSEEYRSKQPSIFSLLRTLIKLFYSDADPYLGLYGAFGYDLAFQFESIKLKKARDRQQRDLVLYLADEIYVVNHRSETAAIHYYKFSYQNQSTVGMARLGEKEIYQSNYSVENPHPGLTARPLPQAGEVNSSDISSQEYIEKVKMAKQQFAQGYLFEAVISRTFSQSCHTEPATLFRHLRQTNPAPYGFFINLGNQEYLVGASPEMFVRVQDKHIETRPISGTIARGKNPLEDAEQIRTLLNSNKDEAELTMCTDVDRNDKSRICEPGSVRLTSRREIEMYSTLIHTVDHVEGILRPEYDALDAFLTHTWVVTVTGAPKFKAMQFIEDHENTVRNWYGGAIGWLNFNGDLNTGLSIRTIHIQNGQAHIRTGATLLYDSDPDLEEQETRLKALALLNTIAQQNPQNKGDALQTNQEKIKKKMNSEKKILLIDHQDSFVHTLANYFRQTGAQVTTLRSNIALAKLTTMKPDLIVLSPGPGRPEDFNLQLTIATALQRQIPLFGVCLGLQAIVEYFGGQLLTLEYPMHGKSSKITVKNSSIFNEIPNKFNVGRYHSLYADPRSFPQELRITAESADGIIMAVEHQQLPIAAVQFHPESILTSQKEIGLKIINNVVEGLVKPVMPAQAH